ncbi:MAG: hypothetical protein HY577_00225 [Candidatus Nealsonbacteria bacterium]|nr:hypothetical protein [Candidatus Nealsonbacteria bacterium]
MINLLPAQEKKEILIEQRLKLVLIFEIGLLLFLVSSLLTLFSTQIYLQGEINSNEIVIAQREKEVPATLMQQEIKELNGELEQVESFYERQIYLADVLKDVFQKLPTGSYLTSFSFVRDLGQKKINLVGFVPSREKLLDFKRSLEADSRFDRVDLPPGNWVSATNIDFYLSLELK